MKIAIEGIPLKKCNATDFGCGQQLLLQKQYFQFAMRDARGGARDIIRGCHNRNKGTAENERLRDPKFIFSCPKNERMIFLSGRNVAQEEISTMRVG